MIILLQLIITEAALTAYLAITRSYSHRLTAILRCAWIVAIIILAALSQITFGLRYYAIVVLLIISAAVNGAKALYENPPALAAPRLRPLGKPIIISVFILLTMLPAVIFPEYRPLAVSGEYEVITEVRYYKDEGRTEIYGGKGAGRKLAAEFWYPKVAAEESSSEYKYPLVVFSHGSFGTRTSNISLYRELASNGYIVCSIDHTYQCFYTNDRDGNLILISGEFMTEVMSENAKEDKERSFGLYKKWMGVRMGDIGYIIDTVKENPADGLYSKIDTDKIGVMGHSLGGAAALGIGRAREDIKAVIALEAPFMYDILAVENNEFVFNPDPYPVPVLNIYSDSAWPHLSEWAQYGENYALLSGDREDVYNLHIEGAGHLSLTDLSLASPFFTRILSGHRSSIAARDCLALVNEASLGFFNTYLK